MTSSQSLTKTLSPGKFPSQILGLRPSTSRFTLQHLVSCEDARTILCLAVAPQALAGESIPTDGTGTYMPSKSLSAEEQLDKSEF